MFTVSITVQADKNDKTVGELSEYFNNNGGCVINVATKDEEDYFGLQFMVTHPEPEALFNKIESICVGGDAPPATTGYVYWEEAVYYIHACPDKIAPEQIMKLLNFSLNAGCVARVQQSRLRNTVMFGEDDTKPQPIITDTQALIQAINILSKKVLGTELLTTLNNKEEVKWPVH